MNHDEIINRTTSFVYKHLGFQGHRPEIIITDKTLRFEDDLVSGIYLDKEEKIYISTESIKRISSVYKACIDCNENTPENLELSLNLSVMAILGHELTHHVQKYLQFEDYKGILCKRLCDRKNGNLFLEQDANNVGVACVNHFFGISFTWEEQV